MGDLVNRAFKGDDVTSKKDSLHPTNLVMLRRKTIHTNKHPPPPSSQDKMAAPTPFTLHPTHPTPQHVLQRKRAENKAVKVLRNAPSINKLKRLAMREKKNTYENTNEKGLLRTPAPGGGFSRGTLG